MRTARVHHAARRRGGGVADRGARAAAGTDAADRRADGPWRRRCRAAGVLAAFRQGLQQLGWVEGQQHTHRLPLGRRRCRTITRRYAAELIALEAGRHRGRCNAERRSGLQAEPPPFRLCSWRLSIRSARLRCKPGASRRQPHRIYHVRVPSGGQMARIAQGDRARRTPCRRHIQPRTSPQRTGQFGAIRAAAPSWRASDLLAVRDDADDRARHRTLGANRMVG